MRSGDATTSTWTGVVLVVSLLVMGAMVPAVAEDEAPNPGNVPNRLLEVRELSGMVAGVPRGPIGTTVADEGYQRAAGEIVVPTDYPTIQKALNHAPDGATIVILPGTYIEDIKIEKSVTLRSTAGAAETFISAASTTLIKAAIVINADGATVLIEGLSITGHGAAVTTGGKDAVVEILGSTLSSTWTIEWPIGTLDILRGSVVVRDSIIRDGYHSVFLNLGDGGETVEITDSVIVGSRAEAVKGTITDDTAVYLERNRIYGSARPDGPYAGGVHLGHISGKSGSHEVVLRNNLIAAGRKAALLLSSVHPDTTIEVLHNTIVHQRHATDRAEPWGAVELLGTLDNLSIKSNVVTSNAAFTVRCGPGATGTPTLIGNDLFSPIGAVSGCGVSAEPDNLTVDPGFADPVLAQFQPGEGSPLLGAADPAIAPAVDIAGRVRPAGDGNPDIGAFEGVVSPYGWIEGVVAEDYGGTSLGGCVYAVDGDDPSIVLGRGAWSGGKFHVPLVPVGDIRIRLFACDPDEALWFGATPSNPDGDLVTVPPGEVVAVEYRVTQIGGLRVERDGRRAPFCFELYEQDGDLIAEFQDDATEPAWTHKLRLPRDDYVLLTWDCFRGRYAYEFYKNGAHFDEASRLVPLVDDWRRLFIGKIDEGRFIGGTVTEASTGEPLEGIFAIATDRTGFWVAAGVTDEDGHYWIPSLWKREDYRILFVDFDFVYGPRYLGGDFTWASAATVSVSGEFRDGVDTSLEIGPRCDGQVPTIFGTEESGLISGTAGDDVIVGGPGDDIIDGLQGDDYLCGGEGDDTLLGGGGADVLLGDSGSDLLVGHAGADEMFGGDGNDQLLGGGDDDTLDGGRGDDHLRGGPGNDVLLGKSDHDRLEGGEGDDTLDGGPGRDTVSFVRALVGVIVDLATGISTGEGSDTVVRFENVDGSYFGDRITGTDKMNMLRGFGGDDFIEGLAMYDRLNGGGGDDELSGGDGDDTVRGGGGDDTLEGNAGFDFLHGGPGTDSCLSGEKLKAC